MPCAYHINLDEGLVTISGSEDLPLAETIALGREMLADADYDPALPHLIDLRGLNISRSSEDSVAFRDFVLQEYAVSVTGAVAVLVNDSLDDKSIADLFHLSTQLHHIEMFDTYELALKWLMRKEFDATASSAGQR